MSHSRLLKFILREIIQVVLSDMWLQYQFGEGKYCFPEDLKTYNSKFTREIENSVYIYYIEDIETLILI